MPSKQPVDLNAHINMDVIQGNPADFPVALQPVFHEGPEGRKLIPSRRAIVRGDNGHALAVVSNRYALVPHTRILDIIEEAIRPLDVGPVQRGIYVDRHGARMRAIFKFPALATPIVGTDEICPCVQVRNTYDGSARISMHIGAFRVVCTNLAVGGGGAFAGGFVSIHAGEIPIEKMADKLADYLTCFDQIVRMYRFWVERRPSLDELGLVFTEPLRGQTDVLWQATLESPPATVFDAYNVMTDHATHRMRSARTAFNLLERINAGFQEAFPIEPAYVVNVEAVHEPALTGA